MTEGSSAFSEIDQLVTSQSANLGCLLHDTADILTNLAQPTNLTNLSQGLPYNQYFFGAVDNIAVAGPAKPTDERAARRPEPDLPAHPPAAAAHPHEPGVVLRHGQPDPRRLPGRRLRHGVRLRASAPATQPGFTPAAGGQVVAPTAQEADVELDVGPRPSRSPTPPTGCPASSVGLLLALGGLVVPALSLAWGARPLAAGAPGGARSRPSKKSDNPAPPGVDGRRGPAWEGLTEGT